MLQHEQLARIALQVANEAGALVAKGFRTHPHASEKSAKDLVTEYDLASEELIRRRLRELGPPLAVVAEEQGGTADQAATWYCDPLDGTTNFVHGHPFWSVSIGILEAGVASVGVVVAPSLGLHWTGYLSGSATRNGKACSVSTTTHLDQALVATGFPTDRSREPDSNLLSFVSVMQRARGVRRCGSAAIDLCLVADGTYDAFWERKLNAWDVTAGAAVVLAAGGRLSALDGSNVELTRGHLIASNQHIHDELVSVLAPHG